MHHRLVASARGLQRGSVEGGIRVNPDGQRLVKHEIAVTNRGNFPERVQLLVIPAGEIDLLELVSHALFVKRYPRRARVGGRGNTINCHC